MTPELQLRWHPAVASMDTLLFLSSTWLRTTFAGLALFWLTYRAWQVVAKPADELLGLLGLEVPVAPTLSLAGIKSDGILLHWKPPESRHTVVKYLIKMNAVVVGEAAPNDTSVTVTSLQPETYYVFRVITLNIANFQAASEPLRVKTLPASSGEFWNSADHKADHAYNEEDGYPPTPVVRPYRRFSENYGPPIVAPPPMTREHSNSISRSKRAEIVRRNTVASDHAPVEISESEESIQRLTEKLDAIRRENEDAEQQIAEEETEFLTMKELLSKEKDDLRQSLKDREDTTKGIKKEVSRLERQNAAAQSHKAQQERHLQAKKSERLKMVEDQERWKKEITRMIANVERIANDRATFEKRQQDALEDMQSQLIDEQKVNKQLEEDIRQKGIAIKELEEERKNTDQGENIQPLDHSDPVDLEADKVWEQDFRNLQARYTAAWNAKEQAEHSFQQARLRLDWINQRRASQPQLFSSFSPVDGPPTRRDSQHRRRRTPITRNDTTSTMPAAVYSSAPPFSNNISSISPTFSSPSPYFNMNNGTMNGPTLSANQAPSLAPSDLEALTAGAPMSPTAGALLPSGLFGDDLERIATNELNRDPSEPSGLIRRPTLLPGLGAIPGLPGLGAPLSLDLSAQSAHAQNPSSPVSVQSQSPSIFASPRESTTNLPIQYSTADMLDSDKRSIRSASSSLRSTTRFGSLFGFSRQRGKTTSDNGPALGSLKAAQTQSLPRQDMFGQNLGAQQRRGSHSGNWMNQLSSQFSRVSSNKAADDTASANPKHVATRRRPFNMFGSKGDPWLTSALALDRPSSPRPDSTKSIEGNVLPRPSTESQQRFGWPVEGFGARNSPLGADWGLAAPGSWSRHPSRRPSVQYGPPNSIGHEPLDFDDALDFPETTRSPTQAPIGTRPTSSQAHASSSVPPTPPKQLNPAAPNFKSLFSREKKGEKGEKASRKSKDKDKDREKPISFELVDASTSPPDPRKSKDTPSISYTTDSNTSPRNSLDRTTSHTPSEPHNAPSLGKESFMSKLSRKSSSGKFNFPSFKSKKQASEVDTPDELDEDSATGLLLGKIMDGAADGKGSPNLSGSVSSSSRGGGLSWSSLKRMGKKGEKPPSLHESIASEGGTTTGDEEDLSIGLGVGMSASAELSKE